MDMEVFNAQHQATATHFKDIVMSCPNYQQQEEQQQHQEKKMRVAAPEQVLKCPRCNSSNTKFCYYNNYSLSQPRYLCKACRRYWTHGGSLRNVPVGGGCRKNKKSSSSSFKKPQSNPIPALPLPPLAYELNGHSLGTFNVDSSGAYCGFGIPSDTGIMKSNEEDDNKLMMMMTTTGSVHESADIGGGGDNGGNFGVDPLLRDYWTSGVGSSSWHGLINSSSFM